VLREEDLALAQSLLSGGLLTLSDLLKATDRRAATDTPPLPLRDYLVQEHYVSEDAAKTVSTISSSDGVDPRFSAQRYHLGDLLGKGANGFVHNASDQRLGRDVAIKFHSKEANLSPIELGRFAHEAQVTGQLSHPSIVPVHDLGILPDGRPFYAMKRIAGDTLKQVFDRLKNEDPKAMEEWTIPHFVQVILRVAQACAFAHDHGVVHRDVKPANIMLGSYGEVLLLDWGVARVLGTSEGSFEPVTTWRSDDEQDRTIVGTVAGTPAYMPPEQAKGEIERIGPSSDVYSIGVVIYEFVVGRRPFRAGSVRELLDKVAVEDVVLPSRRADRRHEVPPDLESVIKRCLEKDPAQRFPDGMALAHALEGFLEGSRRRDESERLSGLGDGKSSEYRRAADAASRKEDDLRQRRSSTAPWADAALRQQLWAEEALWRDLRRIRDNTYDEAIALYQTAVKTDSDNSAARDGLAGLYVRRMEEAERRGELATARFYRGQALRFDTGRFRPHIQGPFQVALHSDRPAAQVRAQRVQLHRDRVLRPGDAVELGEVPLESVALEPGSWLLTMSADDGCQIRLPVYAHRPRRLEIEANFGAAAQVAPGYVFIPGGTFTSGGDPMAIDAPPLEEHSVADFAISAHPVTQAEFKVFLDEEGSAGGFKGWIGPDEISAEERPRIPALGVNRYAAEAYAKWLSRRGSLTFRLPTNDEWEKAARGVDRRHFPWGDDWEPTFCNGPDSFARDPRPRSVGSSPEDCSIYGVFDLSGGVAEWVSDDVPHRPDRGWVRGGSWNSHRQEARISSRGTMPRSSTGGTLGFRLVQELQR